MMILTQGMPIAGVGYAFAESNMAGKVIVVLLFIGSVFVWSVMLTKIRELLLASRMSDRFLAAYRKGVPAKASLESRRDFESSPLFAIYRETAAVPGVCGGVTGGERDRRGLPESVLHAVRGMAERTMADQAIVLENNMGILAIATTTAPFLGLLGTVWGVMDSFGGMAVTGTAMLSAVAPGISGALLTTVIGLLVALPSAIGYNVLSEQVRRMCVRMENFCQELVTDIECGRR